MVVLPTIDRVRHLMAYRRPARKEDKHKIRQLLGESKNGLRFSEINKELKFNNPNRLSEALKSLRDGKEIVAKPVPGRGKLAYCLASPENTTLHVRTYEVANRLIDKSVNPEGQWLKIKEDYKELGEVIRIYGEQKGLPKLHDKEKKKS